ncbi:ABC transporter substrate binding protein [Aliikangiella sp. IMCC44653]
MLISNFIFVEVAPADEPVDKVAVFYPQIKEPYRTIYKQIISGVKTHTNNLEEFVLSPQFKVEEVVAELKSHEITKVIVLGRSGYKLAKQLPPEFKVVSGALPISPNGVSGISLISDPHKLFYYLKIAAPNVKKVYVAYSEHSQWIIKLALGAAEQLGIELITKKVSTTKESIQYYQDLFDQIDSTQSAIWLPLDRIASNDKITLPLILEKAWTKEIVVFSSKPSHAKRGALFSTYPDNFHLGEQLAQLVYELAADKNLKAEKKFKPLQSLQLAVNLRTASHLGLHYEPETKKNFQLVFPE